MASYSIIILFTSIIMIYSFVNTEIWLLCVHAVYLRMFEYNIYSKNRELLEILFWYQLLSDYGN